MAIQVRNLGSRGTQDALLRQLAEQYSAQTKPKVGALGRVLAPITGIGSILDAYYDARFQDRNTGLLNVLKNYGQNLAQGFGTLVTGTNYEQDEKMQHLSDILEKTNPSFKRSAVGRSPWLRAGVDIAGGLLTDPLTYVSFGATSLGDDIIKTGLKAAVKKSPVKIADDVLEGVATKVAGSTLDDATLSISKTLGPELADNFYIETLKQVGPGAKSGALKVLGETVTESPNIVKGTKAFANPLGLAGELVGKGAKKVAPEAYFAVRNIFDPVGSAVESGRTDLAELIMGFQRAEGGSLRKADVALRESGIYDAFAKLSPEEKANVGQFIESARRLSPEAEAMETLMSKRDEVEHIIRNAIGNRTIQVGEEDFLTKLREIYPEDEALLTGATDDIQRALATLIGKEDKTVFDILTDKVESFALSGRTEDAAIDEAVDDVINALGKRTFRDARDRARLLKEAGQEELFTKIITPGTETSSNMKDFLDKYFGFQRGRSRELAQAGFDTISEFDMGYVARGQNIAGYKEDFLKNVLSREVDQSAIERVMDSPAVKKELSNKGYVARDTLEKLLSGENKGILSSFDAGELRTLLTKGGATKERVFQNIRDAEAAGVVYDKNWLETILGQTKRQDEQLRAKQFVDQMVNITDDGGRKLFRTEPEGIFTERVVIPGTKAGASGSVLYTDRVTKKLADDMIDKFAKPEDMDQLLSVFDKAMAKWKGWVTAYGPRAVPYHIRNAMDDTIRMVVGGAKVSTLPTDLQIGWEITKFNDLVGEVGIEEALKQVNTEPIEALYKTIGKKPAQGVSATEDLWRTLLDSGVYSDVTRLQAESGMPTRLLSMTGGKKTAQEWINEAASGGGLLSNREQVSRIAQFANTYRQTGSVRAGVDDVRRVLFNYRELSKAEQEIAKRLVPFYAFTKNNIRFHLETLKNNPEKLARFKNVLDGLQSGTQGAMGEDWEAMPDWMKEGITIPVGKEGDTMNVLGNLGLSIEGLKDLDPAEFASGNLNPLLKILIERLTGKNLFYGEDILDVNSATRYRNYPEALRKLIGYREYEGTSKTGEPYTRRTMSPEAKYWLENIPGLPQVMSPLTDIADLIAEPRVGLQGLTDSVLPATIYRQSVEGGRYNQEKKQHDELYKLLKRRGLADTFQNYYIPEGLREQLLK